MTVRKPALPANPHSDRGSAVTDSGSLQIDFPTDKQRPFPGQATSAAPWITDDEQRTGGSLGQGTVGLAAERNAGALPPLSSSLPAVLRAKLEAMRAHGGFG